ncbi:MAG TPA: winged helix-turn-helix domain-containing protein [Candidatus Acidoferrales bacterium]|nr:winged helix-turn-helix domain-containing protein [Candidatus Acidoferrales bacterium]
MNSSPSPDRIRLPGFELDLRTGELFNNGRRQLLPDQPFQVLKMLLERPGELVTREELQRRLWPADTFVDFDHGLNKAVGKLRDALSELGQPCTLIETLARRGYRFVGPVEPVLKPEPLDVADQPLPSGLPAPSNGKRSNKLIGVAAISVAALLLAGFALNVGGMRTRLLSTPQPIHSVAVLQLRNLSGSPEQDYFAEGFTDELTTSLARISSLRVVSVTSARQYREPAGGVRQVARELGVDAVVEGSVVRSGNRVRITAQLIDARTDTHIWAQTYERESADVLEIQDSISLEVAAQIRAKITPGERASVDVRRSVAPQAYEAYLRGRNELGKQRGSAFLQGVQFFQQAIDTEPLYAPAYAGLADSYSLLANYAVMPPREAFPRANAAARKALELDPSSAEAHTALAFVKHHYDWDWQGAEAEFRRSLELNPSSPVTHLRYSEFLSTAGRHDEAIKEVRQAHDLAPLSLVISSNIGRVLYNARRYDEAIDELQKNLTLDPNRVYSRIFLAMSYEEKGNCSQAIGEFQKVGALIGRSEGPGLAHVYAKCGKPAEARRILAELEQPSDNGVQDWLWIAGVHAQLGEKDRAFLWLDKAYQNRDFFLTLAKVHPYMDPLRTDSRFEAMLKKIGML